MIVKEIRRGDDGEVFIRIRRYSPDQPRDEHGRFGEGGGGGDSAQVILAAAPASLSPSGELTAPPAAGNAESLRAYKGIRSVEINGYLRGTYEGPNTASAAQHVAEIDKTMAVSPLREDVTTYRVVKDAAPTFGESYSADLTGFSWKESAYTSTSASRAASEDLAATAASRPGGDPVLMNLSVPAGTGAVSLGGQSRELLLDRGLTMTVTADHGVDGGIRRLDVVASK